MILVSVMSEHYKVRFLRAQKTVTVPSDEPVLSAARRQGVDIDFMCTEGTCGTCKARLVSGDIEYAAQPQALWEGEEERGVVLLCLALPRRDLVIDEDVSGA